MTFTCPSGQIRRFDSVLVCHFLSLAVGVIAIVTLRLNGCIRWTMPLSYLELCRLVGITTAEVDGIHLPPLLSMLRVMQEQTLLLTFLHSIEQW